MLRWIISLSLIVLFAYTGFAYASSGPGADTPTARDLGRSLQTAIIGAWELVGAVGDIVVQIGEASPQCLGSLICLVLPLACLGAWTLSNLGRILGMMALRDNVRSFLRD